VRALAKDSRGSLASSSVPPATGRIYVGASGDFGDLAPDAKGQLTFHSLLPAEARRNKRFDQVFTPAVTPEGVAGKLRALTNQPPTLLIRSIRLQRAAELLRQDAGSVAEVAYLVGDDPRGSGLNPRPRDRNDSFCDLRNRFSVRQSATTPCTAQSGTTHHGGWRTVASPCVRIPGGGVHVSSIDRCGVARVFVDAGDGAGGPRAIR
jgi:hypothetical protein